MVIIYGQDCSVCVESHYLNQKVYLKGRGAERGRRLAYELYFVGSYTTCPPTVSSKTIMAQQTRQEKYSVVHGKFLNF